MIEPGPNKHIAIVFACTLDIATGYTTEWAREIIEGLGTAGLEVHEFLGPFATPANFDAAVNSLDPYIIVILDHGSESAVYGQQDDRFIPILGTHNHELMENRIVLVLACSSAITLGPACIEEGCLAYCGYTAKVGFYSLPEYLDGFMNCSLEFFRRVASGESLKQAKANSLAYYDRQIAAWTSSPPDGKAPPARAALLRNRDNLVVLGDDSLTIV